MTIPPETQLLLETYLKQLRLPGILRSYQQFAEDAAQANQPYERYLLALAQLELAQRDQHRQTRRTVAARFPLLKELADFDFSAIPSLNKQQVLELAQGEYIARAEPILLIGNPGLGKTHIGIALALAACRQGRRVRFYNAAGLVNELLAAQEAHRLELAKIGAETARMDHVVCVKVISLIDRKTAGFAVIFGKDIIRGLVRGKPLLEIIFLGIEIKARCTEKKGYCQYRFY